MVDGGLLRTGPIALQDSVEGAWPSRRSCSRRSTSAGSSRLPEAPRSSASADSADSGRSSGRRAIDVEVRVDDGHDAGPERDLRSALSRRAHDVGDAPHRGGEPRPLDRAPREVRPALVQRGTQRRADLVLDRGREGSAAGRPRPARPAGWAASPRSPSAAAPRSTRRRAGRRGRTRPRRSSRSRAGR
jgi:hypothetical protein